MDIISLQSGSSGNCVLVHSGTTRVLFDVGISGRQVEQRLARTGHDIRDVDAIVLSHEHSDHICGLGVVHRRFDVPIYANRRTWKAVQARPSTGGLEGARQFVTGQRFCIGSLQIQTYRTPHDAAEGVCFVIEDLQGGQRFGLLTDLGHLFAGLQDIVCSLDAVLLESNYDAAMLRQGPYPQRLKDRIAGKRGHISNEESAQLLSGCQSGQLQWACLGHLSAQNNSPVAALETHRRQLGDRFPLYCADRSDAVCLPTIGEPRFSLSYTGTLSGR